MNFNAEYFGNYITQTFQDVFPDFATFNETYVNLGIPTTLKETSTLQTLYYLLYSKYGNSTVASTDINQFKFQLFSLIFQHGANWERKLDLQTKIRNLSDDELLKSSQQVVNHALNPSTAPSTDTLDALPYINQQTTSGFKKNKVDAYSYLYTILQDDVTESFLNRFKPLFLSIVYPQMPLWYITENE